MKGLFFLAQRDHRVALQLLNHPQWDELYSSAIAFHTHQSLEKSLKLLISLQGIEPPRTHQIDVLVSKLGHYATMIPQTSQTMPFL